MLHVMLDCLDDDDGIINHDANGQHQAEQRQVVQAKSECCHDGERADDRHRHRNQRDDRRPPVLQKQQHHDGDEQHGITEGLEHLGNRLIDERRGVVNNRVIQTVGESALHLLHLRADVVRGLQRVGARQLIDRQRHRRLAVERAGLVVPLGTQLDLRHVGQADDSAVSVGLEDRVTELLDIDEPAHRAHRVLEHLPARHRRLAELAGGDLRVLLLDGAGHVGRGQAAGLHLHRIEPDAHAVVALAEIGDVADARKAREFVLQLNRGVVAQVKIVASEVGRKQVDDHQHAGRFLFHRHAAALDEVGQDRLGQRDAVLHQHLRHIEVDAVLKRHGQGVGAVVGALRGHVEHALDAVDLLFDGSGHRVGDDLRIGAGIDGVDFDGGRRDFRVLRDRQGEQGDAAGQHDDDRQHRREDGPVDEERGEHGRLLRTARVSRVGFTHAFRET